MGRYIDKTGKILKQLPAFLLSVIGRCSIIPLAMAHKNSTLSFRRFHTHTISDSNRKNTGVTALLPASLILKLNT